MKFLFANNGEATIIPVFKETEKIDHNNDLYRFIKERNLFKGNEGDIYSDFSLNSSNVLIVSLGEKENLDLEVYRNSFFKVGRELESQKISSANLDLSFIEGDNYEAIVRAIVEGFLQSTYKFDKFFTKEKEDAVLNEINFLIPEGSEDVTLANIEEAENIMEGILLTRYLVNEPAMYMTPETLAQTAKKELELLGVDVEIFEKEKIEALGMKAFLAVAKGSEQAPKFIVMNYNGNPDSDEKIALVGKGLTYDSGGYSIKTAKGMFDMHCDMGGSGAVIGAMKSIAKSKLKKNVVAIVAACENMISGGAYKTGDIIGSMAGKTIEVINTDAEGRLTLADALYFAVTKAKATKVIDLATLTGACVVALADVHTGAITNDELLMNEIKEASDMAGELVWELPNHDHYREFIKSDRADLRNSGRVGAGTITAGQFLEEFVDGKPWVHLDIAGTAYCDSSRGYLPKFATGQPVKTLYYYIRNNQ